MRPTTDRLSGLYLRGLLLAVGVALAWVLVFPALPALDLLLWSPSSQPQQSLNPLTLFLGILRQTDSGAQQASGTGLLRFVVLVGAALWAMRMRRLPPGLVPLLWPGGLFLLVALLSSLLSSHVHDALLSWLDYLTAGLAFLVSADLACELRARNRRVAPGLAWFVLLVALGVMPAAIARFLADTGRDYGAMVGSFYQPNMFSSYLEFGLGAGLSLYLGTRRGWLAGLGVAVLLIGVYRSYSQGALVVAWAILHLVLALLRSRRAFWLTLPALTGLLLLALAGFRGYPALLALAAVGQGALLVVLATRGRLVKLALLALLTVVVTAPVVPVVAKVDPAQQALTVARGTDVNARARLLFYQGAVAIWSQHPWLGVGPQGFQRYYPAVQSDVRYFSKYTHCLWLTLLCETGILGLLPALVALGLVFWRALSLLDPPRIGLLVGCLGFLAHSSLDVQWEFLALPLTMAIVLGALVGETLEEAPDEDEPAERSELSIRPLVLLRFLVATLLFGLAYLNLLAVFSERFLAAGQFHANAGKPEEAEKAYRQALELDPYASEVYRYLALLNMTRPERREELRGWAERAVRLDAHRPVTQSLLGQVRSELGDREGARRAYLRALELDPVNYPAFYMQLANLEVDSGRSDRAGALLEEARRRFPVEKLPEMLAFRAEALKQPLALIYAASGARENPTENPDRAAEYFHVALELDPENLDATFGLGVAEFTRGNLAEAVRRLEKVDRMVPDFPPCLTYLERAYTALGQSEKAAAVRERLR